MAHEHASAPPATGTPAITVTESAARKLKEIMAKEGKDPATTGLRLGVQGGGCSGMSYFMDFDAQQENDSVFERDGVKVFVDNRSVLYVAGSTLDYQEGLMQSGFAIKNPQEKGRCGCGESFSV